MFRNQKFPKIRMFSRITNTCFTFTKYGCGHQNTTGLCIRFDGTSPDLSFGTLWWIAESDRFSARILNQLWVYGLRRFVRYMSNFCGLHSRFYIFDVLKMRETIHTKLIGGRQKRISISVDDQYLPESMI